MQAYIVLLVVFDVSSVDGRARILTFRTHGGLVRQVHSSNLWSSPRGAHHTCQVEPVDAYYGGGGGRKAQRETVGIPVARCGLSPGRCGKPRGELRQARLDERPPGAPAELDEAKASLRFSPSRCSSRACPRLRRAGWRAGRCRVWCCRGRALCRRRSSCRSRGRRGVRWG